MQAHKRRKKRQAGKLASICNHFECNRPVFGFKFCKYHVRTNVNRNLVENFASILEGEFDINPYPTDEDCVRLQSLTNMSCKNVRVWFEDKSRRDLKEKKRLQEEHLLEIRRRNEADRLEVQYQRIKMLQQASSEGSSKPKQKKYRTKPKLNGNNRIRSSYQMAGLIPLNMDAFAHLDRDKEVIIVDD